MIVLPALAGTVAGCADSHFASSNASMQTSSDTGRTQREPPVQVGYGMTSDGPTTDLYTEIFRPKRDEAPAAPAAVAQGQPTAAAPAAVAQGRPGATSSATVAQNQAAPVANTVPPAPAAPPAEQATPTAYGISSNGPTTDLYTELFGKNRQ
jgi:hypothetical protein